jgi:arylsulfatase A-like enzyme
MFDWLIRISAVFLVTLVLRAAPPNIILIESDDQRADSIAALGNTTIKTPGLDRLATQGFAFLNARNQGSYNGAVCIASRSMCHSGQSLWHYSDNLKGRVTLGEMLQTEGYHTYGTGKWHNGVESMKRSFTAADHLTPGFLGRGHDSAFVTQSIHDGTVTNGKNVPPEHSTDLIGRTAVDFLGSYDRKKPFFLYVGFNAPHDPYTRIPAFEATYRDEAGRSKVPLFDNFLPQPPVDPGVMSIRDEVLLPHPLVPDAVRDQNAIYYGMISHLDSWVGKILDQLKAKGLEENTLVIFTSDHGLARGSHGLLGKQNVYEHSLRVPMLLRGPGITAGGKSTSPIYNFELYRTIAEAAAAKPKAGQVEGESFLPIATGRTKGSRNVVYDGYTNLMRAVVEGDWKLIETHVKKVRGTQLFNLAADPSEKTNLATDPAHEEKLKSLREQMITQREVWDDHDASFWNGIGFGPELKSPKAPNPSDSKDF